MFLCIFKMMLNAERCSVLPSSTVSYFHIDSVWSGPAFGSWLKASKCKYNMLLTKSIICFSFGQMLCRRAGGPEREQSYFELACGRVQHGGQPGGRGGGFATSSPCQETRLETYLFDDLLYSSHCALPTLEFDYDIFGLMPASFKWTDITKLGRVSIYLRLLIKKEN
jgi:hypothetical protein